MVNYIDDDSNMDIDDTRIETPLTPVSSEFTNKILNIKNRLYNKIVFDTYSEEDPRSQKTELLNVYLRLISKLHNLLQTDTIVNLPKTKQQPWNDFPQDIREDIIQLLKYYLDFLQENKGEDQRAPYEYFIERTLYENPYEQGPPQDPGYNQQFSDE